MDFSKVGVEKEKGRYLGPRLGDISKGQLLKVVFSPEQGDFSKCYLGNGQP